MSGDRTDKHAHSILNYSYNTIPYCLSELIKLTDLHPFNPNTNFAIGIYISNLHTENTELGIEMFQWKEIKCNT